MNTFQKFLYQQVLDGYLAQQHKDAVPLGCDQASRPFVYVCAVAHMWISESNLEESALTSHYTGPRDGTRVVRLKSHLLYLLSHLTNLGPTSEGVLRLVNEFTADLQPEPGLPGD